jgi:hypothetical protein
VSDDETSSYGDVNGLSCCAGCSAHLLVPNNSRVGAVHFCSKCRELGRDLEYEKMTKPWLHPDPSEWVR